MTNIDPYDLRDFDLNSSMRALYESKDYFVTLPQRNSDFEESYHSFTLDPDGRPRELLNCQERESRLRNFQSEILEELDSFRNFGSILDVGCGPGILLSHIDKSWNKYGVEISKFASSIAKQFGNIFNGVIDDYQPDISFDVCVAHHVIEHVTNPITFIKKIHSLIKPGGVLIIGTPDFDSGAARRYGNRFRFLHDRSHTSLFSADSMHRFLRDHGFEIYKVEYPFFETDYFSSENLLKLMNQDSISPPFYGSIMTFFAKKL